MRPLLRSWSLCVGVACLGVVGAGIAAAAPAKPAKPTANPAAPAAAKVEETADSFLDKATAIRAADP